MNILRTTLLRSSRDFAAISASIADLRRDCSAEEDVFTDPEFFLAGISGDLASLSVACWRNDRLLGLAFVTERRKWGMRTGFLRGGDMAGRSVFLCQAEDESEVMNAAIDRLFSAGGHSLNLRYFWRQGTTVDSESLRAKLLGTVGTGDTMTLASSYDEQLRTFGGDTRRNFQRYRRKTLEAGIVFDAQVSSEEFETAVARLNSSQRHPKRKELIERDKRLLAIYDEAIRFGLRGPDGTLVSIACGFSKGSRTYLIGQWNDPAFEKLSLSMVLRGFIMEQLITQGKVELLFVGGTTEIFARLCVPRVCGVLLVDQPLGIVAVAKRLMSLYAQKERDAKRRIGSELETFCGSFLPPVAEQRAAAEGGMTLFSAAVKSTESSYDDQPTLIGAGS